MPCYRPLEGWRSRYREVSGKRGITFKRVDALLDMPIVVPCGQCIGCRLERSRQWAVRCVHEASLHERNCFITLTYDDEHLPIDGGLDKSHFQKFMKRLRQRFSDCKITYFHCGEYGERLRRPHYHAILFGFDFPDKEPVKALGDCDLFHSDILSGLWPFGFSTIGAVTFESAAYVARYCLKKVKDGDLLGPDGVPAHYSGVNRLTGEIVPIISEYVTMSLKNPIGKGFFYKWSSDVLPRDYVVVRGRKMRVPKYYEKLFERHHGEEQRPIEEVVLPGGIVHRREVLKGFTHLDKVKLKRVENASKRKEVTRERLLVEEEFQFKKQQFFDKRNLSGE